MTRSSLFGRLQQLAALARHGAAHGLSDAAEIRSSAARATREGLDRRTFLSASIATGALAALPLGAGGCKPKADVRQVLVVGAGIAGLHCTWRLQQAGVDVLCCEANTRLGGRMWTARDRFEDGQVVELGGEFIDTNHATMWALSEEFGIQVDDRWADEPEGFVRDVWWFDGAAVPDDTLLEQFAAVVGKMASDVAAAEASDDVFAQLDAQSLRDWLDTNVPKDTYGALNAVLDSAYRGEFGLENDQQSALNLLYLIGSDTSEVFSIFGTSDERHQAHLGADTFTAALALAIGADAIVSHQELKAVDVVDDGFSATFSTRNGDVTIVAEHVVFAIPFTKLRKVAFGAGALSDAKQELIDTLGYGVNAKVSMGFTGQVWRTDHNASGNVTGNGLSQQLWDCSVGQNGASGILTDFLGGDAANAIAAGAPADWAQQILPEIDAAFPGTADAFTGKVLLSQWQLMPWAEGSYTCYKPGQWSIWGTEGAREGNLHFCGEHCSADFQGWMEGGAETGAFVAAEILDDYGLALTARHRRIVSRKLMVPQPCYHGSGERLPIATFHARRRVLTAAARAR